MKKFIEIKPKDWIIHSISPSSRHLRELGEALSSYLFFLVDILS
jgi:hypothetical protein